MQDCVGATIRADNDGIVGVSLHAQLCNRNSLVPVEVTDDPAWTDSNVQTIRLLLVEVKVSKTNGHFANIYVHKETILLSHVAAYAHVTIHPLCLFTNLTGHDIVISPCNRLVLLVRLSSMLS